MKVALLNRNPHTHRGGDVIMLERLASALRALGIECTHLYGEWGPESLYAYDAVIIYHCNLTWSRDNFVKVRASRRPYVVLPIFYPTDRLGMTYDNIRWALEGARAVCPLSFAEAQEIRDLTGFTGPFTVIPHGTEERFHFDGGEREYVMAANARGDKGEKLVEQACGRLGIRFKYVRDVPHDKLHFVYRGARVFVHSSLDDRMSLTVGEALCSGCRVLASERDRGNEHFPGLKVINPENPMELEAWIKMAWEAEKWDYRPNERARELTWERAAQAWKCVLERVCY